MMVLKGADYLEEQKKQPLLSVKDLVVVIQPSQTKGNRASQPLRAVNSIDFSVEQGETYALLGESGCGKSMSALALMRLLPTGAQLTSGSIQLNGTDLCQLPEFAMRKMRGQALSMIFQEPSTSLNPVLTVEQQLSEVFLCHQTLSKDDVRQRSIALLAEVGIADPASRLAAYPFQLSGGMKQRVMIAMALASSPQFLIADEPTTALDVTIQAQILSLLRARQRARQMGMLLISHDLGVVWQMAHRIGVMYAGELVEEASREAFFLRPSHPYTQKLFDSLPESAEFSQRLNVIPGQVPSLTAMPQGCRFAPRCHLADTNCEQTSPPWSDLGHGHRVRCFHVRELQQERPSLQTGQGSQQKSLRSEQDVFQPMQETPLLTVSNLKVHFSSQRHFWQKKRRYVYAVDDVSFSLHKSQTLALVGESGCGKTTVGKALMRLVSPVVGRVHFAGGEWSEYSTAELKKHRQKMQMVFQDPYASLNPRMTVGETLLEGIRSFSMPIAEEPRKNSPQNEQLFLVELLKQVGLPAEALGRFPHEFSGGQRQRIAIARALAVGPDLLVCDEPTSALDVSVQAQLLNLLKSLQEEIGVAYLLITHNFGVVRFLAHQIAVMYLGRIVEMGTASDVLESPAHPYTKALLAAVPSLDKSSLSSGSSRQALPMMHQSLVKGELPSPNNPPAGCHFYVRCPYGQPICQRDYPASQRVTHLESSNVGSAEHRVSCHFPMGT